MIQDLSSLQIENLNKKIKLPFILEDKILMDPGVWNETYYDSKAIEKAFHDTDWKSKSIRSLFLDHEDLRTSEWIGFIENPRLMDTQIIGDLHIWDENTAIKIGAAGMRCGISPKLRGNEDENSQTMTAFKFENFSIVTNPAVKTAYINLMEKKKMAEENKKEETQPEETTKKTETETETKTETKEELKKKKLEEEDEDEDEDIKKKKKPEDEDEDEEEMSEEKFGDFLEQVSESTFELSAWTAFVGKMRKKGWGMKKIAAAFKKKKKLSEELFEHFDLEEMEDILARKKKYPYPYKEKTEKMSDSLSELKDKLDLVEKKLSTPARRELKSGSDALGGHTTEEAMLGFLQNNIK